MSNKAPLFSIAITTYNHGDYIRATINSVLNQTLQDFEIIVIDDGSPDNTTEEVLSIKDERITYVRQAPSGLPAFSRNRGIERARGKYIALLDGDDIWKPDKLQKTYEVFLDNPTVDIICHDLKIVTKNNEFIRRTNLGPYPKGMYNKLLWEGNCLGISMTTLKREIFFDHNFWFDEDKRLFTVEDYDFWLKLAESGKFHFYYMPEVLAEHIVSEKSAVLSNIGKNAENALYLFDKNIKAQNLDSDPARESLIRKRRSSMMKSAALWHNYKREYADSLRWFIKAAGENPFDKNAYAGLLMSLFRIRVGRV